MLRLHASGLYTMPAEPYSVKALPIARLGKLRGKCGAPSRAGSTRSILWPMAASGEWHPYGQQRGCCGGIDTGAVPLSTPCRGPERNHPPALLAARPLEVAGEACCPGGIAGESDCGDLGSYCETRKGLSRRDEQEGLGIRSRARHCRMPLPAFRALRGGTRRGKDTGRSGKGLTWG